MGKTPKIYGNLASFVGASGGIQKNHSMVFPGFFPVVNFELPVCQPNIASAM